MNTTRALTIATATLATAFALACGNGRQASEGEVIMAPDVAQALQKIQATQLAAPDTPPIALADAGVPPMSSGSGLQVVTVAPLGTDRKALQAAVVFDRPMVALSDLDAMTSKVPLSCDPKIEGRARWAGTTTAVFLPQDDKAFPNATAFTCTVPKGTRSVDGTVLENEIRWTFETQRPEVSAGPRNRDDARPDEPFALTFSQPVDVDRVRPHVQLSAGSRTIDVLLGRDPQAPDNEHRVLVTPRGMQPDTAYSLRVDPGVVGKDGPLPSSNTWSQSFRTYPPLRLTEAKPKGTPRPRTSIQLRFTTPVSSAQVSQHLSITPQPADWSPPKGEWESTSYSYWPKLEPRTAYTVRLSPGITDTYGQQLGGTEYAFTTGDFEPWIAAPEGFMVYAAGNADDLPVQHLNVSSVNARIASMNDLSLFTEVPSWRDALDAALRTSGSDHPIATSGTPNEVRASGLDLGPYLTDGHGIIGYDLWSPDVREKWGDKQPIHKRAVLVVTDLGVNLKVSPSGTQTWVTSLSQGEPVAGATVQIYKGGERLETLTTDANGHASGKATPGKEWKRWDDDQRVWALVTKGSDRSIVHHDWRGDLQPGYWPSWDDDGQVAIHHAFTDRGLYRLGDKVHARATFRLQGAEGLDIPDGHVTWNLYSPDGNEIDSGKGALDSRGGVNVTTQLPPQENAKYGDYSLRITANSEWGSRTAYLGVQARAYRAPAFRVSVDGPAEGTAGEALTVAADARYLFGAPLDDVEVDWSVWRSPRRFTAEGEQWEGFRFGPEYRWWDDEGHDGDSGVLDRKTDDVDQGRSQFSWTLPTGEYTRPQQVFFEARVTDHDRQAIASSSSVYVHSSAWYAGLRMGERLPEAGKATWFEVAGLTTESKPYKGGAVEVEVVRRTWNTVREKTMDGRWRWENTVVDTPVHTESVTTAGEPTRVEWTPKDPGSYRVIAKATDDAGNPIESVDSLYVVGKGGASWARSDDNRIELVPDKQLYQPGDTAKVLVKAPREGMRALISAEREGVLWSEVRVLDSAATALEIPIAPTWKPNVYISVLAVDGAPPQNSPDAGKPEIFAGMTKLSIDASGEHLAVDVVPEAEEYRPGDTVNVTIDVKRGDDAVADAGVTLYAVDEAVLMLTDYQTPDAHSTMYRDHQLMTLTADNRTRIVDRASYLTKGYNPGGGGGEMPTGPKIRKNFLTTITWQPDLKTGPDGSVKASFELPDNLTTFRIMAVVDAGAESFGSDDEEIRVTRPLIARPALPRFLRSGDQAFAGIVAHNNTENARMVTVSGEVSGSASLSGSPVELTIPAMGAVEVPFQLTGGEPGEATFRFTIQAGDDADAVEWTIPVQRQLTFETVATSGLTDSVTAETIGRPSGALPGEGGLTVDVASTLLVGSGAGLTYLAEYPHGCVEQTTSRAMGALLALQIREPAGIDIPEDKLRASVEGTLADLRSFRHYSGGIGYWKGSRDASPMGTAYAVEFMGRAKEAGFQVDQALFDDNVRYLRGVLNGQNKPRSWDALTTLSAQAYVAVALARAGQGDAGHNSTLFKHSRDLSVLGQASLMEAIARTTGPDTRTTQLEQAMAARIVIEPTSASVKENDGRRWARLWGSDDLSTAAVLEAILVTRGEHSLAPRLAKHLAGSRKGDGRWHNTRGTAAVLASLARFHKMYEASGSPMNIEIKLASTELFKGVLAQPDSMQLEVPLDQLTDGQLQFTTSGGRLYYDARLAYVPTEVGARDEGFSVVRTMELVDGAGGAGSVTAGSMLAVTVRVVTGMQRHNVAVVDHLPAGLEPVDTSFATTSRAPNAYGTDDDGDDRGTDELPRWGGSSAFDHHELRDDQVRLYADYMAPGIHTYRYAVRATSPGTYDHPPITAEEMYEPEIFGRTKAGTFVVGQATEVAELDEDEDEE